MKRVTFFAVLLLSGCATAGPSFEELDAALNARLMNHSSNDAIAVFGQPHKRVDKGRFIEWQWEASSLTTSRSDSEVLTTGVLGSDRVPYAQTSTITTRSPVALNCQLRIGVQRGIIGGYGYTGDWGACRPFYERLVAR